MMMIVDMSGANVMRKFCANCGMLVSRMSMSFENRLTILPRGVVSKNDIGHRITCISRPVCRFRDATMLPKATAIASPSKDTAETAFYQQQCISFMYDEQ